MQDFTIANTYSIILKLIFLAGLGLLLYRKKVLNEDAVKFLTDFLIKICVPCLIFTNLIENLTFDSGPSVLFFVGLSIVIFAAGLVIAIIFNFLAKEGPYRKEIIALLAFQNCGYLPMNIVFFLFPSPQKEKLLTFIFLYILGFNILMWSVGSFFIFKKEKEKFELASLLNPPVIAIIMSIIVKRIFPAIVVPDVIFSPMKMLGQMSFVLSMLVLGAGLSKAGFLRINKKILFNIISVSGLKLVLIPFLFVVLVAKLKMPVLLGFFVVLEASMPSAASLPIITRWKGADYGFSSQAVFFTHLFSLITVPFWINFFSRMQL